MTKPTTAAKAKPAAAKKPPEPKRNPANLDIDKTYVRAGDTKPEQLAARALLQPEVRAAATIQKFEGESLDINYVAAELREQTAAIQSGDMSRAEAMLGAQAHTLDALFSNLARRAQGNMTAGYGDAAERYLRLALKAQAQSVRTIEALAELKAPKAIQFIGQANIANGHQQINNGSRAGENQTEQTKLSAGGSNGLLSDTRTQGITGAAHQTVGALAEVNRATDSRG